MLPRLRPRPWPSTRSMKGWRRAPAASPSTTPSRPTSWIVEGGWLERSTCEPRKAIGASSWSTSCCNVGGKAGMADRLRIAIVDDHPLFREGVLHTLCSSKFLEVVGEGDSAEDAVRIAREALPDIMLLDVRMPGGGIEAASSIARGWPQVKIIMVTVSESEQDVAQALEVGAMGYVLKGTSGHELHKTILAASRGESFITPRPDVCLPSQGTQQLMELELQVLALVARGLTNKEAGRTLRLSEKAIKHHTTSNMKKLQVRNRVQAVVAFQNARDLTNKNGAVMSRAASINAIPADTQGSRQTRPTHPTLECADLELGHTVQISNELRESGIAIPSTGTAAAMP